MEEVHEFGRPVIQVVQTTLTNAHANAFESVTVALVTHVDKIAILMLGVADWLSW